jgi:hypothetical protein
MWVLWVLVIIFGTAAVTYFSLLPPVKDRAVEQIQVPPPSPTPIPMPQPTPSPTPTPLITQVLLSVPFAAQAPLGEWSDQRQQDGCEEASVMMAMKWVNGEIFANSEAVKQELLQLSAYQQQTYGEFRDSSAQDTAERLLKGYYQFASYEVKAVREVSDLITELQAGHLLVVPANGKALKNPHFTNGGPDRHMLVIKGYNPTAKQFITNDPGTRHGENYKYDEQVLFAALRDYETGYHLPIVEARKMMIVVKK